MQTVILVKRVWNNDGCTEKLMSKLKSDRDKYDITIYLEICSKEFFEQCTNIGIEIIYVEKWWKKTLLEKKITNSNVITFQINDFLRLCSNNNCILYAENFDDIKLLKRKNKAFLNFYLTKRLIINLINNETFFSHGGIKHLLEDYFGIVLNVKNLLAIEADNFFEEIFKESLVASRHKGRGLLFYRSSMHYFKRLFYHLTSPYGFVANYILFYFKIFYLAVFKNNNYKRILSMKNKYEGKRIFIIATGPSLLEEDVRALKKEYIMGLNSSWKLFKKIGITPDFFVVTDPNVFNREFVKNEIDLDELSCCNNFFNYMCKDDIRGNKSLLLNICFLDRIYNYGNTSNLYHMENLAAGLYDLYTVTEDAINIAIYLGFSEIILLGVDNNYLGEKQHFDNDKKADIHDYFYAKKCQYANNKAYGFLKGVAEKKGIKIINSTRGGFVEAFQRKAIEEIIDENN